MNQFTKNLALEWAKDNIRANTVAPGAVNTELLDSLMVCIVNNLIVKSLYIATLPGISKIDSHHSSLYMFS